MRQDIRNLVPGSLPFRAGEKARFAQARQDANNGVPKEEFFDLPAEFPQARMTVDCVVGVENSLREGAELPSFGVADCVAF